MNLTWVANSILTYNRSNSQKDLPPIHPKQNKPVYEQHADSDGEVFILLAPPQKEVFSQVDLHRSNQKTPNEIGHAIGRYGIHADDSQRKGPKAEADHVDDEVETGQYQLGRSSCIDKC
jgi:hypothetical protein